MNIADIVLDCTSNNKSINRLNLKRISTGFHYLFIFVGIEASDTSA
jgi:hypothetical protein